MFEVTEVPEGLLDKIDDQTQFILLLRQANSVLLGFTWFYSTSQ